MRSIHPNRPTEDEVSAALDAEIEFHLEECVRELVEAGLSPEKAEREAKQRFGDARRYRRGLERMHRGTVSRLNNRGWALAHGAWLDLRYGLRSLVQHKTFTIAAVLSLSLGIGANATIFSLVNSLLIRPLAVHDPGTLVSVFTSVTGGQDYGNTSYLDYLDYKERNEAFTGLAAYAFAPMALGGTEQARVMLGQLVSWDYFEVIGVTPRLGRGFLPEEDEGFGGPTVVVLSHTTWQEQFSSDEDIVGSTVRINDHPFTVVGVGPEGFTGLNAGVGAAAWAPLSTLEQALPYTPNTESRVDPWLQLVGRVKPGIGVGEARAGLQVTAQVMAVEYPESNGNKSLVVEELDRTRLGIPSASEDARRLSTVLMGVVLLVLMIACFNVANLQVAKATARRREIAIRHSLGASRWRIARHLLAESVLLSLLAAAVGLLLALWASDALQLLLPRSEVPVELNIAFDGRVLGFTLLLALLATVVFGLAPALQVLRRNQLDSLKDSVGASQGSGKIGLQHSLVVAQVALSLVLLSSAGLFVSSLSNTIALDPGFELRNGIVAPFNLGYGQYTEEEGRELQRRLLEQTTTLPGVRSATLAAFVPLGQIHGHHDIWIEGYEPAPDELMLVKRNMVSAGYFETMGITVLQGRAIDDRDREDTERVAMINETMARRYWPDRDPIGRTLSADLGVPRSVIGVIEDGKYASLRESPESYLVIPLSQSEYLERVNLVVRTVGDARPVIPVALSTTRQLAPGLPQSAAMTIPEYLDYSLGALKGSAVLLSAFGLLALVLATVGFYGVMSYAVSRRTREFGVRIALGATRRSILRAVLRRGFVTTLIGTVVGVALALATTRLLAGILYDVNALDPTVFSLVLAILFATGQLACYLPARAASKADPVAAFRSE
jgi:putative ABC transport system permease protein